MQTQTVIITGASSGIGLAIANAFHSEGFNVVANSRNITRAGTLAPSERMKLIDGDVADPQTARSLVDFAVKTFHGVDVLINNAGIFVPKPFDEYTLDDYTRVTNTNLAGFFHVTQAAIRRMRVQGGGQVISITTSLVEQPVASVNSALSSITKGAINAVTKELAIEYAKAGIRVNAIAPGIIDTPMHAPENHGFLKGLHPIERLGTAKEIVDAALFLVKAPFVSGEVLHVDGGAHAGKW